MKNRLRTVRPIVVFSVVGALAVAGGPAPVSATMPAADTYPLTGLPVAPGFAARPAMVVKIDNVDAEPQAGLNQADIVFEEIVEASQTRFAAVFNSGDSDPVGPIRSGRTQDVNIAAAFNDPIFVWSGGNDGVTAALRASGMTLLDEGAPSMHRDSSYHGAPHNLFANTSALWAHAGESGDAVPIFAYGDPGPGGTPVTTVDLRIGGISVGWTYDAEQGLFLRSQQGGVHDTTSGPVSTNNVVVILTGYGVSPAARNSPEAVTIGSGEAIVYSRGQRTAGTWSRDAASDPWTLTAGGAAILLQPGRTWVELVDGADYELTDA